MEKLITKSVSTLIGTVIILVASVVIFGGAFALQNYVVKNAEVKDIVSQNNEIANPASSEVEGWKTYTNTEYGFEIKYPQNAELKIIDDYDFKNGCVSIIYNEGTVTFKGDADKAYNSIACAAFTGRGVDNVWIEKRTMNVGNKEYIFSGDTNKNNDYLWLNTQLSERLSFNYSIGFTGKAQGIDTKEILKQILSTFKFTNDAKPFIWEGRYKFSEFALPDENWIYDMTISSNTGKWKIQLNVDGFQTLTRINAIANNVGNSLNVIFDSYGVENIYNNFNKGDVLFTLTPTSDGVVVKWNKMKPNLDKNLTESIFKKVN